MPLDDRDIAAIGQLLDQRLDVRAAEARRRRVFWTLTILLLTTLAGAIAWVALLKRFQVFQDRMAQQEQQWRESKAAYQKLLLENEQMRSEREAAAKAVGYRSGEPAADYEAKLLRGTFSLIGKASELAKQAERPDAADDLDALEAQAKQHAELMGDALGLIGRMLLRNTDPEHNTPTENRRLQLERADGGDALPAEAPAPPGPAPAR